jgi:transposase
MTTLAEDLVPDKLWEMVAPLLPAAPRPSYGGRRRTVPDRNCFAAIVYMARTSTPWRRLPARELGCGSPATAWRRLNEWAMAGLFEQLHWRCWTGLVWRTGWTGRARVWTRPACAPNAGDHVGANPVDRGKPGSKIHLACEGSGLPLTAVVMAANITDVAMLVAVLDDLPAVLTPAGRRRTRPGKLDADKGYDSASNRAYLRRRGIRPRIARRGIESSQRLGRHRWRVERALSWLSCYRRLQVRWDRGSERFFAFVLLACALVCFKRL